MNDKVGMLSNSAFRRSANCGRFDAMLYGKELEDFPIEKVRSEALTQLWIDSCGFEKPVLIENVSGLGLKLPDSSTTLSDIAGIIGPDFPIKVIGVGEQSEIAATVGDYAHYLANRTADHKILNLISLEISATRLSGKVQSPSLVRELDWIDKCWPLDRRARGDFPQVQKYCLCGMAGSYTDFHVDFGGTSVWYHVLSGQKKFYLIPPTTANLKAYEMWTCSKVQDSVFFGDIVGQGNCFQLDLMAGQTLLIPGAWIHAVYTPLDSLVFGGNFLHSFNIIRQLQVYGIEQRTFVGKAYRFPHFKLVNWFVLCSLLPIAKKQLCSPPGGLKSNGDASDSDDDENEDLISLCNSIKSDSVFRQFPYLVRTCQFWLLALDNEEHVDFSKAAQEAWCDGSQDVVDSWWKILLELADLLGAGGVDEVEKTRRRRHVEGVRDMKVLNLMDDRVIRAAFTDDLNGLDDEQDEETEETDEVITSHAQELRPCLRIKLKLSKQEEEEENEEENEEEEERESPAEEEVEEKQEESSLRFKLQMPSISSMKSARSYTPSSADSSSTKFNISISSSSSGSSSQAMLLKSRMALQSERMKGIRTGQSAGLMISKRVGAAVPKALPKAAAKRKVRKIEEYEYEEDLPKAVPVSHEFDTSNILPEGTGGGRYSTRGKRVSAAFLLHAEDVDIREMRKADPDSDDDEAAAAAPVKAKEGSDDDDIPFMFDDDAGLPYGEEEWVAGKSDGEDEREEKDGGNDQDEDDDSDMDFHDDESDEEEYRPLGRKRSREPPQASAPAYLPISRPADKPKRPVGKVMTNRQRLIAKFK